MRLKMKTDWLETGKQFLVWLKQKTGYATISAEYVLSLWAKYGQEFLNDTRTNKEKKQ
jgi:hypothetical protein